MPSHTQTLIQTARPPFLILAPICILLGVSTATYQQTDIQWFSVFLAIVAGISAHISVNMFNEYADFQSGLDTKTQRTPFSGGSGGLIENPLAAKQVLWGAITTIGITFLIGVYFTGVHGFAIVPLGLAGMLLIVTYTQWINQLPWVCLISPGFGFGLLFVTGTHFALTGEYSGFAFYVALIPFLLTNNLLLLNQFPDIEADQSVGRNHFPIRYGIDNSILAYGLTALLAWALVILGILLKILPLLSLITLILAPANFMIWHKMRQYKANIPALMPAMGMNVMVTVLTPLVLALTLFLA